MGELARRKVKFTETIQSLLSYTRAFQKDYVLRSVNVHATDIVEDIMFSNFFAVNSGATYICYLRVSKIMIKHKRLHPSVANLGEDAPAAGTVRITHLGDGSFHTFSEENSLLMSQTADRFVKNDSKPVSFHSKFVNRQTYALFGEPPHSSRNKTNRRF